MKKRDMFSFNKVLVLSIMVGSLGCGSSENAIEPGKDCPCLNDIRMIGSHNSYKKAVEPALLDYVTQVAGQALSESLEYEHISFEDQLDLGLRGIELDVFYDPEGGRYVNPQGLDIVREAGSTPLPYDEEDKLSEPGLKLFHVQDVDFRSHHLLFKDGLQAIKNWSDQNTDHTPIFILIEPKDDEIDMTIAPLTFTADAIESIDSEIQEVFPSDQIITPDDVRGEIETLAQSILTVGWPTLSESQGKVIFVLDGNQGETNHYLTRFPGLKNAMMFVNVDDGHSEAAFMILNDPVANLEQIQGLVAQGYIVRTLADSETREARNNDLSRFENAKASQAQVISTDYYIPSTLFESTYQVIFDDDTYVRVDEE